MFVIVLPLGLNIDGELGLLTDDERAVASLVSVLLPLVAGLAVALPTAQQETKMAVSKAHAQVQTDDLIILCSFDLLHHSACFPSSPTLVLAVNKSPVMEASV